MLCCQTFAYNFTAGTDTGVISLRPYSTPPVSQKNRTLTRKGKKKDLLKQVIGYFLLISA